VENFWNQAKTILRKYNGIDRNAFILFIKDENLDSIGSPKEQLKILLIWTDIYLFTTAPKIIFEFLKINFL
jgi:transposase